MYESTLLVTVTKKNSRRRDMGRKIISLMRKKIILTVATKFLL